MQLSQSRRSWAFRGAQWAGAGMAALCASLAQAITINVVTPDGTAINVPFRWVLQEDKTWDVVPGVTGTALVRVKSEIGTSIAIVLMLKVLKVSTPPVGPSDR